MRLYSQQEAEVFDLIHAFNSKENTTNSSQRLALAKGAKHNLKLHVKHQLKKQDPDNPYKKYTLNTDLTHIGRDNDHESGSTRPASRGRTITKPG